MVYSKLEHTRALHFYEEHLFICYLQEAVIAETNLFSHPDGNSSCDCNYTWTDIYLQTN
jgi:hypothetical protein